MHFDIKNKRVQPTGAGVKKTVQNVLSQFLSIWPGMGLCGLYVVLPSFHPMNTGSSHFPVSNVGSREVFEGQIERPCNVRTVLICSFYNLHLY